MRHIVGLRQYGALIFLSLPLPTPLPLSITPPCAKTYLRTGKTSKQKPDTSPIMGKNRETMTMRKSQSKPNKKWLQ